MPRSFFGARSRCLILALLALFATASTVAANGNKDPASIFGAGPGTDACVTPYEHCNGGGFAYREDRTIRCVADALRCYGASAGDVDYLFTPETATRDWYRGSRSAGLYNVCHETADRCSRLCHETLDGNATSPSDGAFVIATNCDRACIAQADRCAAAVE